MNNVKFNAGQEVSYRSSRPGGIDMRSTKVIGFYDTHENQFKPNVEGEYCPYENRNILKNVPLRKEGVDERRYIISHYHGWYPHTQPDLKEGLALRPNTRYYFAYESELTFKR